VFLQNEREMINSMAKCIELLLPVIGEEFTAPRISICNRQLLPQASIIHDVSALKVCTSALDFRLRIKQPVAKNYLGFGTVLRLSRRQQKKTEARGIVSVGK
jgi:hypothetical protein